MQEKTRKEKSFMYYGSWNVCTLQDNPKNPERKTEIVARVLSSLRIDIAALSETRFPDEGHLDEIGGDYKFFWSARPGAEARHAGVGFANIKLKLARNLESSPIGISDRLMTLRIEIEKGKHATLNSAYAPTMTNSDEVKEQFYEDLRSILAEAPSTDKILLLGDFNARVGNNSDAWPSVIGCHRNGKINSNGLLLLSLCSEFELGITNTMFRLQNKYKGTWPHP